MVKQRIPETNEGIQDAPDVLEYDVFLKTMRDRGWMETGQIIKSGIREGLALEIGPGPGYLGLEWLQKTNGSRLEAIEISRNMIALAEKNAKLYGLEERVQYVLGNAMDMPFEDNRFDAVFSNGSLHEWEDPQKIMCEIHRVLRPGGRLFISDLRRDSCFLIKWFMQATVKPKSMQKGLSTSLESSYTREELEAIVAATTLKGARVEKNLVGLTVTGNKT